MFDHPDGEGERRKELCTFLVRCWSDPGDDVLVVVKSFSIYEAAQDARFEYPEYDNHDPVCFLQNALVPRLGSAVEEGTVPRAVPTEPGGPAVPAALSVTSAAPPGRPGRP
jgi:hypothetical protein